LGARGGLPTLCSGKVGAAQAISANGKVPSPPLPSLAGRPTSWTDWASTLLTTASCQPAGPNNGRRWAMRASSSSHTLMSGILA
jgi:hypothetical protein